MTLDFGQILEVTCILHKACLFTVEKQMCDAFIFVSGDPLYVGFDLTIASFDSISEVSMDYTITMYLNQYWKDERLSFSPEENRILTLSGDFAEKIWVPDTFFANDKNRYHTF